MSNFWISKFSESPKNITLMVWELSCIIINHLVDPKLLLVDGLRLMSQASRLVVRLMAHCQELFCDRLRAWGSQRQIFLAHEA